MRLGPEELIYITTHVGRFAIKVGAWCLVLERDGRLLVGRWDQHMDLYRQLWPRKVQR